MDRIVNKCTQLLRTYAEPLKAGLGRRGQNTAEPAQSRSRQVKEFEPAEAAQDSPPKLASGAEFFFQVLQDPVRD